MRSCHQCPLCVERALSALCFILCFVFNDTATTEIYTLSLHDALPISKRCEIRCRDSWTTEWPGMKGRAWPGTWLDAGSARRICVGFPSCAMEIGRAHV